MLPNGLWGSGYGSAMRHNDKGVLNMSGLVDYLVSLLHPIHGDILPGLYGGNIYPRLPVIFRSIQNPQDDMEWLLNKRNNSFRQSIELGYGNMFEIFHIMRDKAKHKLLTHKQRAMRLGFVCFFFLIALLACEAIK